jgi:hypothetical protein
MRNFILWALRIITMPFRLAIVLFFTSAALIILLPVGLIVMAGDPESAIDAAEDLWDGTTNPDMWKSILLGFGN